MAIGAVGTRSGSARPAAIREVGIQPMAEDGHHHQDINSFKALGLAIVASMILTGLLWTVL